MGFLDCEILLSRASFSTTFLKNCGRGESLQTTTCLKAVVGMSKGMLTVNIFYQTNSLLGVSKILWRS